MIARTIKGQLHHETIVYAATLSSYLSFLSSVLQISQLQTIFNSSQSSRRSKLPAGLQVFVLNELSDLSFFDSAAISSLAHEWNTAWHFTTYPAPQAQQVCKVWSTKMWRVFDERFWTSYGLQLSVKDDNNQLPELHQQMQNTQQRLVCVHRWLKCLTVSQNQAGFLPWWRFLPQSCPKHLTNLVICLQLVFKHVSKANKSPFVNKVQHS